MENKVRTLGLPSSKGAPPGGEPTTPVQSEGPIVVIGANGSGKTRLGAWINLESENMERVRRISAQKSLAMPTSVASIAIDQAYKALLYGYADFDADNPELRFLYQRDHRWQQKPAVSLLNDYDKLMTYLFSEANDTNTRYVEEVARVKDRRVEPPETMLRATKRVWEEVLPHRRLEIGGGKVETRVVGEPGTDGSLYNASEMSDGERVIFYLIGQALSAPQNGIVVVDEPELHLHRSIQARLWDAIETERSDCLFVYLTHDLDFAASRVAATKVWLEGYDGSGWDWHEVEGSEGVPEELYLEILGGRKPVLFCEGHKGGLDYFVLQKALPGFTVAPCGTASQVFQATRSFASLGHLHNLACRGVVDRDFREDAEVEWLESVGVYVLDHSEMENVLLSEGVMRTVVDHLRLAGDYPALLEKAKGIVFCEMIAGRERLVSSIAATKVERRLKENFDAKAQGRAGLRAALDKLPSSIVVETIYDETAAEVDRIIDERDYARALRLYDNKGLLGKVEPLFGFARKGMLDLVKRLASSKEDVQMASALREELPKVEV